MKTGDAIRFLWYGQLCFYVGLLICFILRPAGLTNNAGISFYGTMKITIIPYCLALLGPAYYFIRFGLQLAVRDSTVLKYALISFGIFIIGLSCTPYTAGRYISDAHLTCGTLLFLSQLLLSIWITARLHYDFRISTLTILELMAGIMSFLYLSPKHGYLTESQSIFQICFGLLALYSLPRLLSRPPKHGTGLTAPAD
jgi:hypothetical protein